jgi:hypothetical protein
MAQPYDLSGIASLQISIAQMLKDQKSGAVKFAGGFQTWQPNPTGYFKAILASGGQPTQTTTNLVRISLRGVRTTLDLLAGGTGSVAANVVQASTPPTLLLETGKLQTGQAVAFGPLVNAPTFVANTSYDLSGIAALQTMVNAMLADQQSGTTVFAGNAKFSAILTASGVVQNTTTLALVIILFSGITANFDLLDQ